MVSEAKTASAEEVNGGVASIAVTTKLSELKSSPNLKIVIPDVVIDRLATPPLTASAEEVNGGMNDLPGILGAEFEMGSRIQLEQGYSKRMEQELHEQIYNALISKSDFEVPDTMVIF